MPTSGGHGCKMLKLDDPSENKQRKVEWCQTELFKPIHSDALPLAREQLLKVSQLSHPMPAIGEQVFKYLSLSGQSFISFPTYQSVSHND